jgi:hypothetical protein
VQEQRRGLTKGAGAAARISEGTYTIRSGRNGDGKGRRQGEITQRMQKIQDWAGEGKTRSSQSERVKA